MASIPGTDTYVGPALSAGPWRPETLEQLRTIEAPVVLLLGDSGAGKTRVLEGALQDPSEGCGGISTLRRADQLEMHLTRALAAALAAAVARDSDPAGLIRRAAAVLARQAECYGAAAAIGLGRRLADLLSAGLASEIRTALKEIDSGLALDASEQLIERLNTAAGSSPLERFSGFAGELDEILPGRLLLGIDRGELLDDAGIALLLDLLDEPPERLSVIVAVATDSPRTRPLIAALDAERHTPARISLPPLEAGDIARIAPHLKQQQAERALTVSQGNPRRLADLLTAGAPTEPIGQPLALAAADTLTVGEREHARALALYPARPGEQTILRYLGIQAVEWQHLQARLTHHGLLDPDGWMHEARRAELAPPGSELPALAHRALLALSDELAHDDSLLIAALELAERAEPELEPAERSVLAAGVGTLAQAAALLELDGPGEALPAHTVRLYAAEQWTTHTTFIAPTDIVTGPLLKAGETKTGAPTLTLTAEPLAVALIRARLLLTHGRAPVPKLAETLLGYGLARELAVAESTTPRVGAGAFSALLGDEAKLRQGRESAPTLMALASFRSVPIGLAVRYPSTEQLEQNLRRLRGLRRQVLGKWLTIEQARRAPARTQPSERFTQAMEYARLRPPKPVRRGSPHHDAQTRHRALRGLARLLDPEQRLLATLDEPFALGIAETEGSRFEIELRGGREATIDLSSLPESFVANPFRSLTGADQLTVSSRERVHHVSLTLTSDPEDPLTWALARVKTEIENANERLAPTILDLDDEQLSELLVEAVARMQNDAETLATLAGEPLHPTPSGTLTLILPEGDHCPLARGGLHVLACWSETGRRSPATVERSATLDPWAARNIEQLTDGLELPVPVERIAFGPLHGTIAELLGYRTQDVEIRLRR